MLRLRALPKRWINDTAPVAPSLSDNQALRIRWVEIATCVRYPVVPGYPKDPVCAVIRLGEGTNLVANVVGCAFEDLSIGMKVKGKVEQVDDKTILPQFYPA